MKTDLVNVYLQNNTKKKLAEGRVAVGCGSDHTLGTADRAGFWGMDFVRFEGEHGLLTWDVLDSLAAVAQLSGVTPTARVPACVQHEILHYADAGILGITIPHTSSAAVAAAAVNAAKHYPLGMRGDNLYGKLSRYGMMGYSQKDYYDAVNEAMMVIALIEDAEGLKNAEKIVSVPGIDVIDIGPYDLAQSMGLPEKAELDKAVEHIVGAAVRAGKPVGVGSSSDPGNPDKMRYWMKKGCRYFLGGGGPALPKIVHEIARELGIE